MNILERKDYVQGLLNDFHTRMEASEKLAEKEELTLKTAKNFVYTMFSGSEYDDRQIVKRARQAVKSNQ